MSYFPWFLGTGTRPAGNAGYTLCLAFCLTMAMLCGFIAITSVKNKDTSQHRAKCPYRLLIQLQTVVLLILEVHSEFPEQSVRVSIIFWFPTLCRSNRIWTIHGSLANEQNTLSLKAERVLFIGGWAGNVPYPARGRCRSGGACPAFWNIAAVCAGFGHGAAGLGEKQRCAYKLSP